MVTLIVAHYIIDLLLNRELVCKWKSINFKRIKSQLTSKLFNFQLQQRSCVYITHLEDIVNHHYFAIE
jgi:hypothetical protein